MPGFLSSLDNLKFFRFFLNVKGVTSSENERECIIEY